MQGDKIEEENIALDMDRVKQMVRMKRVLLSGKHLPETAPVVPSKLNPRDVLGEDGANVRDYRQQSLRAQSVFNRLYPATRAMHQTDLRFLDKCAHLQQLTNLRDRAWIDSAPTVTLVDDQTVLKLWSVQLKHFVCLHKEAKQRMGVDIDDTATPNLLAFGVECTETPSLVESVKFKTRRRGIEVSILIKYDVEKLIVESDVELEGLSDVIQACALGAVPVDVMIRENLWLLVDRQLSDIPTDLC
uniref:Uncharacterized protein n=1 Tax=Plectus sambesii TaxID=2011161 RepID=A0A914VF61_9BILA